MVIFKELVEFIWDQGNKDKNWMKHKVTIEECEEVFFDPDKQEYPDPKHSKQEERKIIVGKTAQERLLLVVYTTRLGLIRIISTRDLNKKKEADLYEKAT